MENFYEDYQRLLDFKKECGWYENKETSLDVFRDPRFRLPDISNSKSRKSKKSKMTDLSSFLLNQQQMQAGMDKDMISD